MKLRRALSAVVLSALAAGGLTACETKVGLAAEVGSHRLSDSDLSGYVSPGAKPYVEQTQTGTTTVVPKLAALELWLRLQVLDEVVRAHGGPITSGEQSAATVFLAAQGTSAASITKSAAKSGYRGDFGQLAIDQQIALVLVVERLAKVTSPSAAYQLLQQSAIVKPILSAVTAAKVSVSVSGRYGAWDPASLSLSQNATAGLPSFVLRPSAAATAAG